MRELASPRTRSRSDPLASWAARRIRLDGRPFRFEDHEYLRAIYDDTSAHVVLSKAAQIGGTTWAILKSIHACGSGLNVGYFFPTHTDVIEFSKSRVSPLLAENPFLARTMTDTDTAGLKRIGEAFLYLRGMKSEVGMKSIPADMIVFDELNEATPDARTLARERIAHSDYKRMIELSNPSLPGYGIDEQYERSDQRHWTLKCPSCGEWTCLEREFPKKLGEEVRIILPRPEGGFYRACPRCQAELDVAQGEWVAEIPGREIHGYRISQLFSVKIDPGEIMEEYRTTRFPERFFNLKIGIPWADLEHKLDPSTVLSLCQDVPEIMPKAASYCMGVDTGKELHVVVLRQNHEEPRQRVLVHVVACRLFSELDELMKRFRVSCCVIDGLPETHATRDFARAHPGTVFMNFFNESQRGAAKWDAKEFKVQVNRTEALDASREAVREHRFVIPRGLLDLDVFARHMACDAKVLEEDKETGAKRYRYVRTGADHYSLAFTYAWMAVAELPGPFSITTSGPSEFSRALARYDGYADRREWARTLKSF
jgi:hypothetical protein